MTFIPRTQSEMYAEDEAYLRANTDLTDFNRGSRIRELTEVATIGRADIYTQMAELLKDFSLTSAVGAGLDRRGDDFGMTRRQAVSARTTCVVRDNALVRSSLLTDLASAGGSTVALDSADRQGSDNFPTVGYPYWIRIGEGTNNVEDVQVSANNTTTDILTTSTPLANPHYRGERVSYVTGASDRTFGAGLVSAREATGSQAAATYRGTQPFVLVNGNYESERFPAVCTVAGAAGNTGVGRISTFSGALPFAGAEIANVTGATGGADLETDSQYRERLLGVLDVLACGTATAVKVAMIGVSDPVTGETCLSASAVHDLVAGEVLVYCDNGAGAAPVINRMPATTLRAGVAIGAASLLGNAIDFPTEGALVVSAADPAQGELIRYTAATIVAGGTTFVLDGVTVHAHDAADELLLVDVLVASAESGQRRCRTTYRPLVTGSYRLFKWAGNALTELAEGATADYLVNRGTGEVEFVDGLGEADVIGMFYSSSGGLLAQCQRVLTSDPLDLVTYPGVAAAGVRTIATAPTVRRIRVRGSITAEDGFIEEELRPLVAEVWLVYLQSLAVGQDVVIADLIARAKSVPGVREVIINTPSDTVPIGEDEKVVPYSASGQSLVSVT